MDENRLAEEILALEKRFPVRYSLKNQWYMIKVNFPAGWEPGEGPMLFEVPNTYPQDPPSAFIREEFEYEGGSPKIKRWSSKDGWADLCIHPNWDPDHHSTITWLELALVGLENPNSSNPYQKVR